MTWPAQHLFRPALLDNPAQIHDSNIVRQVIHHRKIVGDEQVGNAEFTLQMFEQIQYLRLHRHIKRGSWLVADQQLWLHGQRTGNGNPLPLPAGKFMRITVDRIIRQTNLAQQGANGLLSVKLVSGNPQGQHALGQNFPDAQTWIQRGKRVLKHHLHFLSRTMQCRTASPDEIFIRQPNLPARWCNQLQQGLAHRRLAATGFTHQRQGTTGGNLQRNPVDRTNMPHRALQHASTNREMHLQILDTQQRRWHFCPRNDVDRKRHHGSRLTLPMAAHLMPG